MGNNLCEWLSIVAYFSPPILTPECPGWQLMVKEPILEYKLLITYMPDQKVLLYMEILRSIFRLWKMSRGSRWRKP